MRLEKLDAMIEQIIVEMKAGLASNIEIGNAVHDACCRYRFATLGHVAAGDTVRYAEVHHFAPPGATFTRLGATFTRFSSMVVNR